jgi:mannose-6-phosphate isomerase-like protein (cupin superfamily)
MRRLVFLIGAGLLLGFGIAAAQNSVEEVCAALVTQALEIAEEACSTLDANTACYGHPRAEAEAAGDAALTFETPGDKVMLSEVARLQTAPYDAESGEWGIVVVQIGEAVEDNAFNRLLLVGDTTLSNGSTDDVTAFTIVTGAEESCVGAPNSVVMQSAEDTQFSLNGAELALTSGSTAVVTAVPEQALTMLVLIGEATVSAAGEQQTVSAGQMTAVALGGEDGLLVIGAPEIPEAFDFSLIQFLPLHLVSATVEIPAADRWTDTGVEIEAGQAFLVVASELVKTIDYMPWSAPEGHSTADCRAVGREDWDCRCRTLPEWGTCTVDELASMTLVGRVGEGEAFIVGAGGFFTADTTGTLFLGPNDNTFTDNVGAYQAIIVVEAGE